ncbi:MAG: ribosome maturation factor RimM [Limnochordales bacterium]|mgnify:FL=1|jgi:16S rRNA processing protein RimM|nr:MAG: 16S rRNA processing protein RimM [Bacillota bacterium]
MDDFVSIGEVTAPHGVRGEVRVWPRTDFPERFQRLERVFVRRPGRVPQELAVERARFHKGFVIVKLEGVDTRDDAETLRGALLQVPGDQVVPLPEDHYYVFQIVGLEVVDEDGRELGVVKEVLFTGANDVYVVERADGSELLLPAVKDVVLRVDVDAGRMVVRLLPGLE